MEKIKLEIAGLSYSQTQSGAYALVLAETKGKRRLPIIIGGFEAQAIAIELEKMTPSRPLTHDLFKNFAEEYNIDLNNYYCTSFSFGKLDRENDCINFSLVYSFLQKSYSFHCYKI